MSFKQIRARFTQKVSDCFQILDYACLLPASTYLPVSMGLSLARMRGLFNAVFDLDWRSLSTGVRFVRKGTWQVMGYLRPEGGAFLRLYKTVSRFVVMSREEWEACFFARHSMQKVMDGSTFSGFEDILMAQQKGWGVVLLSATNSAVVVGFFFFKQKTAYEMLM